MRIGGLEKLSLIDYPGKLSAIIYTIGCNFRCPYCHNPELVDETADEIPTREILEILKERKKFLDGVSITGGEPTIHDDLLEFINQLKKLDYFVKLDSNGTRPAMLKEAIDKKLVDYIAMDIKSPLAKYNATVGRAVDQEAIKMSIDLLRESPIDYEFRTTLIKSLVTPEDLEQIGQEIKGAKKYYLQKFVPTKILNPQFRKKTTYSTEELEALQAKLSHYVDFCGIR